MRRKIFLIVHYVVFEEQKIIGAPVGLLFTDLEDNQKARSIDTWPGTLKTPNVHTIRVELP